MAPTENGKREVESNAVALNNDEILNVRKLTASRYSEKVYTYDEALVLAGHGKYNIALLLILCVGMHAMTCDVFGFSVVVSASVCDLHLSQTQRGLLLTMPLVGSIFMAYPWGYIADTKGRKRALLLAISGSFIFAVLGAFSVNWIVLAVFKFLGTACSSGIQSLACTLLGESCSPRYKSIYVIILSSFLMSGFCIYTVESYLVSFASFSLDLGLIMFTPWRLLALILASPLSVTLIGLTWCYESPKFLLNAGLHDEALKVLRNIHNKNGVCGVYPVKRMMMNEMSCLSSKDSSLQRSLWEQTVPLFKPPLVRHTLLLYYLTIVIYTSNNGFFGWLPFFVESFSMSISTTPYFNKSHAFCEMISSSEKFEDAPDEDCTTSVSLITVWASMIQGVVFTGTGLGIALVADRKKWLLFSILLISSLSSAICVSLPERISSMVFFFGVLFSCLNIGVLFSYFVDLYPTSYRGMASCLGMMVARASAVVSVQLIGAYAVPYCSVFFYAWCAFTMTGVIGCFFLPPDTPRKKK